MVKSLTDLAATVGKWLLVLVFLTLPLNTLRPVGEIALADFLIPALFLISFLLFVTRASVRRKVFLLPRWFWIGSAILVLSIGLIELFPAPDPGRLVAAFDNYGVQESLSIVVGSRLILALAVFPVVVGLLVDRWTTVRLLVNAWIIGVTVSCAVAVLDAYFGFGLQKFFAYDPDTIANYLSAAPGDPARHVGLTDHPNTLSLTTVMVSPLVMAKMTSRQGLIRYAPVLALMVLAVAASGTRTGLIVIAIGAVLTLAFDRGVRQAFSSLSTRTVVAGISIILVVAVLIGLAGAAPPESEVGKRVPASLSRIFNEDGVSSAYANNEREAWIEDSIDFISERPVLGHGFQWVEASHNTVLQLLLSGGVIALVGFALVIGGYLKLGFGLRSVIPEDLETTSVALAISLILYLISGITTNHIFERYLYIPAGLILALYMLHLTRPEGNPAAQESHSRDEPSASSTLLDRLRMIARVVALASPPARTAVAIPVVDGGVARIRKPTMKTVRFSTSVSDP